MPLPLLIPALGALFAGARGAGGLLSRKAEASGEQPGFLANLFEDQGVAQRREQGLLAQQESAQFDQQFQQEAAAEGALLGTVPYDQRQELSARLQGQEAGLIGQLGQGDLTALQQKNAPPKPLTSYQREALDLSERRLGLEEQRIGQAQTRLDRPPQAVLSDMIGRAADVEQLDRITAGFRPEFVGRSIDAFGRAEQAVARRSGSPDDVLLVQFWQDYQGYVNTVRNKLFGAALTPSEQAEFEKTIVTPNMNPAQAEANLVRQRAIARAGYERLEKAYSSEYNLPSLLPPADQLPDGFTVD